MINFSTLPKLPTLLAFMVAFFLILFLKRCYNEERTPLQPPAMVVSPTLDKAQDESNDYEGLSEISLKSYGRKGDGNLVDKLYQDLVQKTPELQQVELKLDSLRSLEPQITKVFNDFERKSTDYYASAEAKGRVLSDSVLRKDVKLLVEKSRGFYKNRTGEWKNLLLQLNSKSVQLDDYHNLLKIHLTLPLIEDFQKKRLPSTQEIQKLLLQQAALQRQIDSLMKK